MRKTFDDQKSILCYDIDSAQIPEKCRDAAPALFACLKEIYLNTNYRYRILELLSESMPKKKQTGRKGLTLWQIFVLAQCRMCLNITYDRLHYLANYDQLLRHLLGIRSTSDELMIKWEYQRIYDNVNLLTDKILKDVNDIVVEFGHQVFKKKRRRT